MTKPVSGGARNLRASELAMSEMALSSAIVAALVLVWPCGG